MAKRIKRDRYGRYAPKSGGIKPFKSNLKGVTRKGAPNRPKSLAGTKVKRSRVVTKKRVAIAVGVAAAGAAVVAANRNQRRPLRRSSNPAVKAALRNVTPPSAYNLGGRSLSGARIASPARTPGRYNRTFSTNRYGVTRVRAS